VTNETPPPGDRRHGRAEFEAQVRQNVAEVEAQMRAARDQFEAANEAVTARVGRNLVFAIGAGVVLGGLLLVSLIILPWLFIFFGAALVGFAAFELASALRFAGRDVPRIASVVVAVAVMPAAFFLGIEGLWLAVIAAIVILSLWRLGELLWQHHRTSVRDVLKDLVAGAFVQLYVTLLGGLYVVLTGREGGQWWTLGTIVIVVSVDFGAWLAGVSFGKHPMAPSISPKKTWEGFAGAAASAVIAGVLIAWLMLRVDWWVGIPLGLVLLLVATGGDLVESLIKRDLGIKDISTWLPGHGGFLDRLDSILPSAAIGYAAFLIFAH
jgi:phosphatidate cytidylyltransferase